MLQHGPHKQQHAEAGVQAEEQQLPAVVVPVGPRQVAGGLALLLVQVGGLQPVGSTGRRGRKAVGEVVTGSQRYWKEQTSSSTSQLVKTEATVTNNQSSMTSQPVTSQLSEVKIKLNIYF